MNLSLTNRVKISFIVANIIVLITGFLMYFFLGSLAQNTKSAWAELHNIREIDEVVRKDIVDLNAISLRFGVGKTQDKNVSVFKDKTTELKSNLERLKTEYSDSTTEASLQTMIENVNTLNEYIGDPETTESKDRFRDSNFHINLVGKISEEFSKYIQRSQIKSKDGATRIQNTIASIKKNMLLVLIIAFLGTIILGWLIPNKVALPFKKINHAIRELQDCNFDVSISYDEKDEIGELSLELNKMIKQFKQHEDLRADKFAVETKKFDIIANHIRKNILVVNSEGRLSYMNNALYSMLSVESGDVIDKEIEDTVIPEPIVEAFGRALKRRTKIEDEEIVFTYKKGSDNEEELEYKGLAEIYPIRGKESSLDYYLMVISEA